MSSRSPAKKPLPNEFLASLDAAFGASNAAADTQYKYTRKAAISVGIQKSQQAYQGTKKKRKRNASQAHSQGNKARWHDSKTPNNRKDSLYHKLDSESISLGVLGAYLVRKMSSKSCTSRSPFVCSRKALEQNRYH